MRFGYLIILITVPFITGASLRAQDLRWSNHVYKESIRTVLFHREGWELSYPHLELHSNDRLVLAFDDLSDKTGNYFYTIYHCDSEWHPTPIAQNEYLDGFTEAQIYDYAFSFNTTVPYIHYRLLLPNEDMQIKLSGNYILLVFEEFNRDQPVFSRRFSVYEPIVSIDAQVHRPVLSEFQGTGQEVDVTVNYRSLRIENPSEDTRLVIRQNGRWDNVVSGLPPMFYRGNTLVYDYNRENVFPGINEFRYFDTKSLRYQSEFIRNITMVKPGYHVELFPSEKRSFKPYFYTQEINGRFLIDVQEGIDKHTDADYCYVYFTLPYDIPFSGARLYVAGGFNGWEYREENEMKYNAESRAYELRLLLKQGYYNYYYVLLPDRATVGNPEIIEGSHFQTENDYIIYVYYKSPVQRYERLVGLAIVNSVRR